MKTLISITAITIFFLTCPLVSSASYLIQLKNGSEFLTPRYWEEGDQVKFHSHGGVVTVPKDSVREIKESDRVYREEIASKKDPKKGKETDKESTSVPPQTAKLPDKEADPEVKKENEKVDFEYYRKRKVMLKGEIDESVAKYLEASGNRDPEAKEKARREMTDISKQIFDLADELKEKNKGVLPDWWEKW